MFFSSLLIRSDEISRARYSAQREQSLGLVQWDGTHIYKKRIPFESESAQVWNNVVFQYIQKEAIEESLNNG